MAWFARLLVAAALLSLAAPARAQPTEIVFLPHDNTAQGGDYPRVFTAPQDWAETARRITTFGFPVNHLLFLPPEAAKAQLAWVRAHHLALSVGIPSLPVDRTACGGHMEGMIWPGEAAVMARKLQALGAAVDIFTLDLPLSDSHLSKRPDACHFTVAETARHLARSIHELRDAYPHARIVDLEVPTGLPLPSWTAALTEWLSAYRQATGEALYGLTLDIWWPFDWQPALRATAPILAAAGVKLGVFVDSSHGPALAPAAWTADARANTCALRRTGVAVQSLAIANWLNPRVPNLPDTDPATLSGLARWVAEGQGC